MFTMNRDRLDKVLGDLEQEVYDRGAAAGLEKGRLEEGRKLLGMLLEQKFGADASRAERLENLDLAGDVLVTGSFFTVGPVLERLSARD